MAGPSAAEEGQAVFKDTSRIASVGGSVTEIVYALGEEGKLVARDSTSVYPEAAMKLPDVGYMRQLSPEGVLSVNPSGLIVLEGSGPQGNDRRSQEGKRAADRWCPKPSTMPASSKKSASSDERSARTPRRRSLPQQVDADLAAAERLTAGMPEKKRVLFILSMQGGKILAAGSHTAADGIIQLAGAVNAVEGFSGYKQLSDEAAIMAKPDIILMMDRFGGHDTAGCRAVWTSGDCSHAGRPGQARRAHGRQLPAGLRPPHGECDPRPRHGALRRPDQGLTCRSQ